MRPIRNPSANGLPDISLLQPLAAALDTSVLELINGDPVVNGNRSANILRTKFYVCPVCGNVIHAVGDALISCCGITLLPLESEPADAFHEIVIEAVENEHFVSLNHEMTKTHYISFLAFVSCDRVQLVKCYPEGNAETRFQLRGHGFLYAYCNKHGLIQRKL